MRCVHSSELFLCGHIRVNGLHSFSLRLHLCSSNLHVDRKPVTPDDEGSHACWRSPRPSSGSCSRKRDDCSASPNKKEERRAKSPKQSIEYKDEKRRSCTADDMNGRHNAVNGYKK